MKPKIGDVVKFGIVEYEWVAEMVWAVRLLHKRTFRTIMRDVNITKVVTCKHDCIIGHAGKTDDGVLNFWTGKTCPTCQHKAASKPATDGLKGLQSKALRDHYAKQMK